MQLPWACAELQSKLLAQSRTSSISKAPGVGQEHLRGSCTHAPEFLDPCMGCSPVCTELQAPSPQQGPLHHHRARPPCTKLNPPKTHGSSTSPKTFQKSTKSSRWRSLHLPQGAQPGFCSASQVLSAWSSWEMPGMCTEKETRLWEKRFSWRVRPYPALTWEIRPTATGAVTAEDTMPVCASGRTTPASLGKMSWQEPSSDARGETATRITEDEMGPSLSGRISFQGL